jgi:hypothetical protein
MAVSAIRILLGFSSYLPPSKLKVAGSNPAGVAT